LTGKILTNSDKENSQPVVAVTPPNKQQTAQKAVTGLSSRMAPTLPSTLSNQIKKKKYVTPVNKKKKSAPKNSAIGVQALPKKAPKKKRKQHGSFESWSAFGNAGSYGISGPQWRDVSEWVSGKEQRQQFCFCWTADCISSNNLTDSISSSSISIIIGLQVQRR
jgi:hypothetical protein